MARRFAAADTLQCAVGNANLTRAGTVIVLVRAYDATFDALTTNTDFIFGRATTTAVWGVFLDSGKIFAPNDFGAGLNGPTDKNTWYAIAVTKASGTSAYRYHIAAVGGAWTHGASGTSNDGSGVTNILFGAGPVKGTAKWDIAAAATYSTAFNDAAVEALGTSSMATWMSSTPTWAVQFNQASTATAVTDLTGGGGDQTAISGTSVVTDPVGWTYFSNTVDEGVLTATLPALSGALAGGGSAAGTLTGTLPALVGAMAGDGSATGSLTGTLPALVGAFAQTQAQGTGPRAVSSTRKGRQIHSTVGRHIHSTIGRRT